MTTVAHSHPGPQGSTPLRILIVEDDDALREVVAECLVIEGYNVDSAEDGLAGLEACARARPDAVVLDLVMPRLDGQGFLRRLREDPDLHDVPVLVATGTPPEDVQVLDVAALLQKPVDLNVLLRTLARVAGLPGAR